MKADRVGKEKHRRVEKSSVSDSSESSNSRENRYRNKRYAKKIIVSNAIESNAIESSASRQCWTATSMIYYSIRLRIVCGRVDTYTFSFMLVMALSSEEAERHKERTTKAV